MNRKVSVAPMMDCTDKHERYFLRLISKNVLLYTEMIVSEAIDRGDKKKLLSFNLEEKPVALQIGGSSPTLLGNAAKAKNMIKNLIDNFEKHIDPKDPTNNCLDVAIITAPEKRTQKTKDKLKTIAGRALNK